MSPNGIILSEQNKAICQDFLDYAGFSFKYCTYNIGIVGATSNGFEFVSHQTAKTILFVFEKGKFLHPSSQFLLGLTIRFEQIIVVILDGLMLALNFLKILLCDLRFAIKIVALVRKKGKLVLDRGSGNQIVEVFRLLFLLRLTVVRNLGFVSDWLLTKMLSLLLLLLMLVLMVLTKMLLDFRTALWSRAATAIGPVAAEREHCDKVLRMGQRQYSDSADQFFSKDNEFGSID